MVKRSFYITQLWKLTVVIILVPVLWNTIELINLEVSRREINLQIEHVQRQEVRKLIELSESVSELFDRAPVSGAFSDLRAYAHQLIYTKQKDEEIISSKALAESIKLALNYFPQDALLWVSLVLYYKRLGVTSEDFYAAYDSALEYGKNNSVAMKSIASLGIAEWPKLTCYQKAAVLGYVKLGMTLDDSLLSEWNNQLNLSSIADQISETMRYYRFDLEWAERQVNLCTRDAKTDING